MRFLAVFKGKNNTGFLTIEKSENSIVPLGIFEITEFDEYSLDCYEGYPTFYYKEYVDIIINGILKRDGHCPCRKTQDNTTLCPCDEFVKDGICKCKLFIPIEEAEKIVKK